ncbi:MAG: arsenite methyltransferase [Chloroflexi bacterium]|nr:MAG: arsenite methyltransferase [Chloroflexota bacterium]
MNTVPNDDQQLREAMRERYGRTALEVLSASEPKAASCCGADCCGGEKGIGDAVTSNLYSNTELAELPLAAALVSLGCGNPTALASLKPGEKVLDLGSGGGIDVLLSARRVGSTGFAYGLDMTDAMLELAERNRAEAGIENVRFLKGEIEHIPLPANTVDVVISNCVINLSADKRQVLREAFRVLVPGGRFAVSDIVFQGQIPPIIRADLEAWAGCVAGALEEETYRQLLAEAGFTAIEVEVTRRYALDDIVQSGAQTSIASLSDEERAAVDGKFVSAFIRAQRP